MNLKPLGERIVIKRVEEENTTASGIVLPSSAKEESNIAEVVAIGKDILDDEKTQGEIEVGDKVIFSKYAGNEIEVDGEKVTIVKYADLLAVIK